MTSHPEIQKIRLIGLSFENRLHWQFWSGGKSLQTAVESYIFIYVQKSLIHNSLNVFDNWGEYLSRKKTQYNYS